MVKELLITFNDFSFYRDISVNINKSKDLEPYILQAQRMDLQPVLGAAFYLDVVTKTLYPVGSPTTNEYDELVNGVIYKDGNNNDIQYYGLKPLIVYYAYARMINNNDFKVTKSGNKFKTNDFSTSAKSNVQNQMNGANSAGLYYQNNLIEFLCKNSTDFPLWRQNVRQTKKTSVSIVSSSGRVKFLDQGDSFRYDID